MPDVGVRTVTLVSISGRNAALGKPSASTPRCATLHSPAFTLTAPVAARKGRDRTEASGPRTAFVDQQMIPRQVRSHSSEYSR